MHNFWMLGRHSKWESKNHSMIFRRLLMPKVAHTQKRCLSKSLDMFAAPWDAIDRQRSRLLMYPNQ